MTFDNRKVMVVGGVVLVLVLVVAGGFWFGKVREMESTLQRNSTSQKEADKSARVIEWNWYDGVLTYEIGGETKEYKIQSFKPVFIVPKRAVNGVSTGEELVYNPMQPEWRTAVCPGDAIEIEVEASTSALLTVRNKGPHSCAK